MAWKDDAKEILKKGVQAHFSDDPKLSNAILKSRMVELVVSLPFISGCPKPEALAEKNLALLQKETKKPGQLPHRKGMSLRKRLEQGDITAAAKDKAAAEKGMLLLELASLQDHLKDRDADLKANKPNPLNDGTIVYPAEKDRLVKAISAIPNADIDGIVTADAYLAQTPPETSMSLWYSP
jgi:hypothetical protein